MSERIQVRFCALSIPLHEQFDVEPERLEKEQKLADSIVHLYLHDILTDGEAHKARKRLMKLIEKA